MMQIKGALFLLALLAPGGVVCEDDDDDFSYGSGSEGGSGSEYGSGSELPTLSDVIWPPTCPGTYSLAKKSDSDLLPYVKLRGVPDQSVGYDFFSSCPNFSTTLYDLIVPYDEVIYQPPGPPPIAPLVGCFPDTTQAEKDQQLSLIALWIIIVIYMFYGLAHVCEDFLVPGLNILCDRCHIPEDVAGATLMAAGCNAPELFASIIGVFIQHSTVGAGTVVGSAPFNLMCICGGASMAVGGQLFLDGWLMGREIFSLCVLLIGFLCVMADKIVHWWEALILVILYAGYAFLCVYTQDLLRLLYRYLGRAPVQDAPKPSMVADDQGNPQLLNKSEMVSDSQRGRGMSRIGNEIFESLSRAVLDAEQMSVAVPKSQKAAVATSKEQGIELPGGRVNDNPFDDAGEMEEVDIEGTWSALVADCKSRVAQYMQASKKMLAPEDKDAILAGVLLKKSRFYSRVRMGRKTWQKRHFILDNSPTEPLRYCRLDAEGHVKRDKEVVIDLFKVLDIVRVHSDELHLVTPSRRYIIRCNPGDTNGLQKWFDMLVVKLDELRNLQAPKKLQHPEDEQDEHGHKWWVAPDGTFGKIFHYLTLPLKAVIHWTIPDVHTRGMEKYYPVTLIISAVWLALLAYVMTLALNFIGCGVGINSTVMGLTAGAVGTSFPNLYASILTARAGQAGMSICQAFGSNTFNMGICLGLVWLFETVVGQCQFGQLGMVKSLWCAGCYMPTSFTASCPYLPSDPVTPVAGSLTGTVIFVFVCILALALTFIFCKLQIPKCAAMIYFGLYGIWLLYEIVACYVNKIAICPFGPKMCL